MVILVLEDSSATPTKVKGTAALPIKDKPSDLGLKDIIDKDSWIEASKIINARLRHSPYSPSTTSKALVTTPKNQAASSWWEEAFYYYVKPPISDLFVENPQFNQKGFKIIACIDQYFHPLGAVDSLGYIFQLIDIMQGANEPVITLKVRFSCLFVLLKMGVINIEPPFQVGFMLCSLLSTYNGVDKDFKLGRHSLTTALLQTVIDQCIFHDKDPWKGPVGKDGKPSCGPPANAAGASASCSENNVHLFESMGTLSFNKHLNHWRYNCKDGSKSASSATTLPATKLTAQKTVPFSSGLVKNWSRSSAWHQIPMLHLAWAKTVLHLLLPQLGPR